MQVKPNNTADSPSNATQRLMFFKRLQTLTNKIHASSALDQIMVDLIADICDLFDCDRLTIYVGFAPDGTSLISKVKKGLHILLKIYACQFPTKVSLAMWHMHTEKSSASMMCTTKRNCWRFLN